MKEVALAYMGDHEGLIRDASEVLLDNPDHLPARLWRGSEYILVGEPEKALRDLNKALEVGPDWVAYQGVGIARAMLGDYDAAIAAFKKAIKNYHSEPTKLLDSDVAPEIQAATHHAWMTYDGMTSLNAMRYEIAVLHACKGDAEFEKSLSEADAVYPKEAKSTTPYLIALNWASWILRGKPDPIADYGVFAASGALWERTGAVQHRYYEMARQSYLKFEEAHENRKREQYAGLADFVAEHLRHNDISGAKPLPADQPATWEIAWELATQADFEEIADANSVQLLDRAIKELEYEHAEQDLQRRDLLVGLYLRRAQLRVKLGDLPGLGDLPAAHEDAERVIKFDPYMSEAYRLRAGSESDPQARREDYRRAVEYGPFNDRALQDFAEFLAAGPEWRSALQLLQRRLRLVAPAAEDHEKIARLQFDLGQKPEALASVNKAMAITSDPDLLDELGQLRSKIEKQDRRARDHNKNRKKGR
jgi:tetratricopeptide (TPR) repeat protein